MPTFNGRDAHNRVRIGDIDRDEVPAFIGLAMLGGWRRVAIAEHLTILGAYRAETGGWWIHPQLMGAN